MDVAVLIPSKGRPAALAKCVDGLAQQTLDADRYRVFVGLDGADDQAAAAARTAWRARGGVADRLHIDVGPGLGYINVRHRLQQQLEGELFVSLNDDVIPDPGFLAAHRDAHLAAGDVELVVGASPFVAVPNPTIIDRLVAETDLVFFHTAMAQAADARERDWGFRHCFGLNFSVLLRPMLDAGGFIDLHDTYGYDDLHLGWRVVRRFGGAVRYRPEARAPHDHRHSAKALIAREYELGRSAWRFAQADPDFMIDVLGRDIRDPEEIAYMRDFVDHEWPDVARQQESFLELEHVPGDVLGDGASAVAMLEALRQHHLLLRRHTFRRGILHEIDADAVTRHRGVQMEPSR